MIERLRAIIEQPGDCYHLGDCVVSTVRAALPALLAAAEALPKDPWLACDGWNCYSCDAERQVVDQTDGGWVLSDGHAPDCAWSKAMALRGEG